MIISKKDGKVDLSIFHQHIQEMMSDGDYYVQVKHMDSPTKKMLGYFMGHEVPLYQSYLESSGIHVDKKTAANYLKEAMGFGEPQIDFEMDLGLTEREWQSLIEKVFFKLLELGCNPVHPKDR